MAISLASLTAGTSALVQSSYATASVSPTTGLTWLLWVGQMVNATDTAPTNPTASGAGLTWTIRQSSASFSTGAGFRRRRVHLFEGSGTPSTGAVTIDFAAQNQFAVFWDIWELTGADSSALLVQTVTNGDAGGTVTSGSITLAAAGAADNRPVSAFFHSSREVTTPRTNWTEVTDQLGAVGTNSTTETQWRSDTFETTASATWATGTQYGGVAAEVKASVAGATENPYPYLGSGYYPTQG